jgi:hypothetical protein
MSSEYAIEVKTVQPTIWVYRKDDGTIGEREQTKEEREEQVVPPRGEYTLRVKAFAKKFEMDNFEKTGKDWMTRLLLEIVDGGKANLKGQQTTALCSMKMSGKSNLGQVYMATTGESLEPGRPPADPTLMLEKDFVVYLKQDKLNENGERTKTVLAWDTIERAGGAASADGEEEFQT